MQTPFERFGKYKLLERLGEGGMAEVYLALSPAVDGLYKLVTIKKVLPQLTANSDFVALFKSEARVVLNLNHANVLSIFDFGFKKGQYYLVMDYVQGCTLREILDLLKKNNSRLSIEQILYIIREVANGLEHAHNCLEVTTGRKLNIIHQDIKPDNIMISFEGAVKIIDFGIAKADFKSLLEPLDQSSTAKEAPIRGTAAYMSPEHIMGEPVDGRSDVFSLGVVFWELITGQKLFVGKEEADVLVSVITTQVPSVSKYNPSASEDLNEIVGKALMKAPHDRYQSAQSLFLALNKYLNSLNPNYTSHSFSTFIRELTSANSQRSRDKIVEYTRRADLEPVDNSGNEAEDEDESDFSENPNFTVYSNNELTGLIPQAKPSDVDFKTATVKIVPIAAVTHEIVTPIQARTLPRSKSNAEIPGKAPFAKYGVIGLFALLPVSFFGFFQYRAAKSAKKTLVTKEAAATQETPSRPEAIKEVTPQPETKMKIAYLNVSTHERNENVVLFIDGKKIFDKPPVVLPVTAERNFVFSALNVKTNETSKFSFNLAEGEQKSIDLFP